MVRIHFRETPSDLFLATCFTLLVAGLIFVAGQGTLLGLPIVLFVPGYLLLAGVFPGNITSSKPEVDWIERMALSFCASLGLVSLLGLLLAFVGSFQLTSIVVCTTGLNLGLSAVAYWRRMRLPPDKRLSATIVLAIPNFARLPVPEKWLAIAIVLSLGGTAVALVYVTVTPAPEQPFTEFYILGPTGQTSGYPTTLNSSQEGAVILGIVNHESTSMNYTVRVDLVGVQAVDNPTSGTPAIVDLNRTEWWGAFNTTLAIGAAWNVTYTFSIANAGYYRLEFILFENGVPSDLELQFYIRVY